MFAPRQIRNQLRDAQEQRRGLETDKTDVERVANLAHERARALETEVAGAADVERQLRRDLDAAEEAIREMDTQVA
jgi:hypothetical protein